MAALATALAAGDVAAQAPRRHAILIGVERYAPAPPAAPAAAPPPAAEAAPAAPAAPEPDPDLVTLDDLQTPCDDVDAISAQLQQLGWKDYGPGDPEYAQDEITVLCDEPLETVRNEINARIEAYIQPKDFLFIYMAGHGAEINGRNYFFGTDARLDMANARQRLQAYRGNKLFLTTALELAKDVFDNAGRFYTGNIFLVLDTCRDDPFAYTRIETSLGVAPLTSINVSQDSRGFLVLYAAAPGAVIEDGTTGSYLARTLVDDMQSSLTVDLISSNVKRDVSDRTRDNAIVQDPGRTGSLNRGEICFSGCALFARDAARDSLRALRAAKPSVLWPRVRAHADTSLQEDPLPVIDPAAAAVAPAAMVQPAPAVLTGEEPTPALYQTIYQQQSLEAEPDTVDFDVFWCQGDGEAQAYQSAAEFSRMLASRGDAKLRDETGSVVGQVRTRPLSIAENAAADLRVHEDVVRYDDNSQRESIWAATAARFTDLAREGVRSNTPDSIDVYFCRNATAQAAPARVWVQVARQEQRGTATLLIDTVRKAVADAWVESEVEVVESSPDRSQVRYFFSADRANAQLVADAIAPGLGAPPQVAYVKLWSSRAKPGQLEIWIGKDFEAMGAMKR
jgi:hypothetical protein